MISKEVIFGKGAEWEPYLLPAIVILVAMTAFGLGRLSAAQGDVALRVLYPDAKLAEPLANTAAVAAAKTPSYAKATDGAYVASKNGTKYYLVSCSSANRIKQENKVYFGSIAEAQAAGYEPAANCPGL